MPRSMPSFGRWRGWLCTALWLLCGVAAAQSRDDQANADPPSRAVRLAYLSGAVALLPAGAQTWIDASLNRPLAAGERLSTTPAARVELELPDAALRLDGRTDLALLAFDDQLAQFELGAGSAILSVRNVAAGESYEIDTPRVALVVDRPGVFRVDVDRGSGTTTIGVLSGSASVYGEHDARRDIFAGRNYRFEDTALDRVTVEDRPAEEDDFEHWSAERDRRYVRATSTQYVDETVVGYPDLDAYGSWQDDADYGPVWYPAVVAVDWAPYRYGHWDYVGLWGWTWVDDLPWGFAPYHYGRWIHRPRGWCWIPGPRGVRPVYAPALVAFIGDRHTRVAVGVAPVGWLPLGPGDVYVPWYRASHRYFDRVNETNLRWRRAEERTRWEQRIEAHYRDYRAGTAPPVDHYVNWRAPHALTAIDARAWRPTEPVQRHRLELDPSRLRQAGVLTRLPPPARQPWPSTAAQAGVPPNGPARPVVMHHRFDRPSGTPMPQPAPKPFPAGAPGHPGGGPGAQPARPGQPGQSSQPDHPRDWTAPRPGQQPEHTPDAGHPGPPEGPSTGHRPPLSPGPAPATMGGASERRDAWPAHFVHHPSAPAAPAAGAAPEPHGLPQPPRFSTLPPGTAAPDSLHGHDAPAPVSLPSAPSFRREDAPRPPADAWRHAPSRPAPVLEPRPAIPERHAPVPTPRSWQPAARPLSAPHEIAPTPHEAPRAAPPQGGHPAETTGHPHPHPPPSGDRDDRH